MLGHILLTAINAVMPIVLLILLGCWLRKKNWISDSFLKDGNKLVFRVCLPAMLFVNIYNVSGFQTIQWDVVIFSTVVIILLFFLGLAVAIRTTKIPQRRGVVAQCIFRSNFAIIGLPLAQALGGEAAMGTAAIVSAFSIPIFNIFGVIALTMFIGGNNNKHPIRGMLSDIIKNPLIVGVVLALACLGIREAQVALLGDIKFSLERDMAFLYTSLGNLKNMATPLGLIVLGGGFQLSAVKGMFKEIAIGSCCRLLIAPMLGLGLAILLSTYTDLLHCTTNEYASLIALFGTPVAVSSAVMAGEMGNDEQLATQLVMWTSIFSVFTVFLQVCILMSCGLLMA